MQYKTISLTILLVISFFYSPLAASKEKHIILIGNPRGATTAFERYMIKRNDYQIHHEPVSLNAWLTAIGMNLHSKNYTGAHVLQSIHESLHKKPYFIKDMAFFLNDNKYLLELVQTAAVQVVFLIRDPQQAVISHYKLAQHRATNKHFGGTLKEMQYSMMEKLFFKIKKITGKTPLLIDADELIDNPKQVLSALCARLEIPFTEEDLTWESGEKNFWGFTADSWQLEVTNSQGFNKRTTLHNLAEVDAQDRPAIETLIRKNTAIYNRLSKFKLNC